MADAGRHLVGRTASRVFRAVLPPLLLLAVLAHPGCGPDGDHRSDAADDAVSAPDHIPDVHSHAVPSQARVTHVDLDLAADFERRQLSGTATLTLAAAPDADAVVLDVRGLTLASITDGEGLALSYEAAFRDPLLGSALRVALPDDRKTIVIRYATDPGAEALQWLEPAQTAGGRHPYLFSQGQAILTRTWIPTQDSPGIRQTYAARIVVPRGLRAVMGAEAQTPDGVPVPGGTAFEFRLDKPVPPYLFALAIGDIAFRPLGPRTGVYAEPSVLDGAADEFRDLERMVEAAESIGGPYRWGRYDVLVLPPSFPFGGMENPVVTFATPTILAGDRSLTSLIAHELAHSWSGNLVSNATWRDFWLNEGFTTYFENRIMEALYGRRRADMLAALGHRELLDEIARLADRPGDQVLHLRLDGRNPDDAVTPVAYDKGALFLRTVETAVGRDRFDRWLRGYFDRHAFTSLTTERFMDDFQKHLTAGDEDLADRLQVTRWIEQPGIPANAAIPTSEAFNRVAAQASRFEAGAPAASLEPREWSTQEWQHFLQSLPPTLTPEQLADLDHRFGLSRSGNSEVLFTWLRVAVRHAYRPAYPALARFLTTQGRRKFLKPLYEALMETPEGREEARRIYAEARPRYHPVARDAIDQIVTAAANSR